MGGTVITGYILKILTRTMDGALGLVPTSVTYTCDETTPGRIRRFLFLLESPKQLKRERGSEKKHFVFLVAITSV